MHHRAGRATGSPILPHLRLPGAVMEFTRRNFLGAGTGLAVNATLATASGGGARAESIVHPRTGAFDKIDATLRRAVAERKVAGVVAMAATEKGIAYQGAFGKRDA